MITLKQESVLLKKIKSLSELEFSSLLKEISDHIDKNRWGHMIDECFDIETYEDELEETQEELNQKESAIQKALSILSNIEELDDDIQKEINKAIVELS